MGRAWLGETIWAFDQEPAKVWFFAFMPLGLFLAGWVGQKITLAIIPHSKVRRALVSAFFALWLTFMGLGALLVPPLMIGRHLALEARYENGGYLSVEGEIFDFHPAAVRYDPAIKGSRPESFRVGDIEFSYHPRQSDCHCFNNSIWDAGLQNGDHVRIAHIDGHILRLERRR